MSDYKAEAAVEFIRCVAEAETTVRYLMTGVDDTDLR